MPPKNSIKNGNGNKYEDYHLGRIALKNMKEWKDAIHQVELSSDEVNTHGEVRLRSVRVAGGLQSRGLGVGDIIVICGNTHNDTCLPILASFYIGCAIFPFPSVTSNIEVKRMLEQGIPKLIFCDPCMEEIFTRALRELNIHVEIVIFGDVQRDSDTTLTHITPFSEFLKPTGNEDSFEAIDFDPYTTLAAIIYSSGSTGLPKGVCLTHSSLAIGTYLLSESDYCYFGSGLFMNFSNYFWISATWFLTYTFMTGTPRTNCYVPYTDELLKKVLPKYKPETLQLYPVILHDTLKSPHFKDLDFSSVKAFFVGGAPISESVLDAVKSKVKNGTIYLTYGTSEAGHISINKEGKTGSVGKPLPWIKWKIVDTETRKPVNPGEQGELCVKTETLFKCYLNSPEATSEAFDEDGYFKTGDLFTYDNEGFFYFIERVKEVMRYRCFQITPTEVELEIRKLPDVLQVCVVGKKDEVDVHHPVAFVQKREGSDLTEQDIKNVVKDALGDHKNLRGGVVFMKSLPQTASGKINRRVIREMAQKIVAN